MYEVYVNVSMPSELEEFFEVTRHFNKKFYVFRSTKEDQEPVIQYLMVKAVAISRDLIYLLTWIIPAKQWISSEEFSENYEAKQERTFVSDYPEFNLVPKEKWEFKTFYPYFKRDDGSGDYRNCFYWNSFIRVGDISRDGKSIS